MKIKTKLNEATSILKDLGMPNDQLNERSALTLLCLANIKPENRWDDNNKIEKIGVTPIMNWMEKYYKKKYAPNTRETIRRQTLHQFVEGGIAIYNPDKPDRPTNSPKACYQITNEILELLKYFNTNEWRTELLKWKGKKKTLTEKYSQARDLKKISINFDDKKIRLSPGEHNKLIKDIIEEFAPRFAQNSQPIYIGDTGTKEDFFNDKIFKHLKIEINKKGKLPDVVLYDAKKKWLYLIESVTSHGPIDGKRKIELEAIFNNKNIDNILVTAFPDRKLMSKYIGSIAWESEVWLADNPTHLIHFNGHKFMGPF